MHRRPYAKLLAVVLTTFLSGPFIAGAAERSVDELIDSVTTAAEVFEAYGFGLDTVDAQKAALAAMVKTADRHGRYLTAEAYEQMQEREQGLVSSIGVRINVTEEYPEIVEVIPDTPAAESELKFGDRIESINDQDTKGLPLTALIDLLRGPLSESVHLKLRHPDDTEYELDLMRSMIPSPSMQASEVLPGGFAYMKLNGLYDEGIEQIVEQFREWEKEKLDGAILDLRGASGTSLDAVKAIAELFAESGSLLFTLRDREDQDLDVLKAGRDIPLDMPLMALIDNETTGAAETLAAVFKGSARGVMLLGRKTDGDLIVRESIPVSTGDYMYIATRRLVVADGTIYDGESGVVPDVLIDPRQATFQAFGDESESTFSSDEEREKARLRRRVQNDPVLRRAAELLSGLKALNIRSGARSD